MRTHTHTRLVIQLLLLFLPTFIHAQWHSIGDVDGFKKDDNGITVTASPAKIQIKVLAPNVIRVRMARDGNFAPDSSWAVIARRLGDRSFKVREEAGRIVVRTPELTVQIARKPCRIAFYNHDGQLVNQDDRVKGMAWAGREIAVWKEMPQDENYYGFGEKSGGLAKRGASMSMWNSDIPAYAADTDPLYESIPFFYGIRNGRSYGIFLDNTYFSHFDMGKESPRQYSFGAMGGELNYYFIYGPTPKEVLSKFTELTGRTPMPPRWALGYQQCRWSYYPESRVREIASNFRSRKIPCDAIYLDIHYMDGYRCFTWDTSRFRDPKTMVGDLAKDGFKIVVIIDPGIKKDSSYWVYQSGVKSDAFVKYPDGKYFSGKVWPGECVFPDFTKQEARTWWGSLYKNLLEIGVKGFWNDMNEPSVFDVPTKTFDENVIHDDMGMRTDHNRNHNIYGMQMARATREGVLQLRGNERPFVLTRANYAGGNRYAAAWTGDNVSSWEHLSMAIPMCLNLSISGQPFVGSDIGGFIGTPSGELYARWLQLGVFTPLMRSHAEINSINKEPWEYGSAFEAINKRTIELRYEILPYIYSQFRQATITGIPLMRPLVFDYADDHDTYWNDHEFLFGDAFLVAPVVEPGQTKRTLRLPAGTWYDYWTGEKHPGREYATVAAPVERIPLFVKAGSIIPQQHIAQYTDQSPMDPLILNIFPAVDSSTSSLYEDDGISFDYQNGKYSERKITLRKIGSDQELILTEPVGSFKPPRRAILIRWNSVLTRPPRVSLDGKALAPNTIEKLEAYGSGWNYDAQAKVVSVRFEDRFRRHVVRLYE